MEKLSLTIIVLFFGHNKDIAMSRFITKVIAIVVKGN